LDQKGLNWGLKNLGEKNSGDGYGDSSKEQNESIVRAWGDFNSSQNIGPYFHVRLAQSRVAAARFGQRGTQTDDSEATSRKIMPEGMSLRQSNISSSHKLTLKIRIN
jgi:hypothetical protein